MSVFFDGVGSFALLVACPAELKTYPFWVGAWVQNYSHYNMYPDSWGINYTIWSAERTASHGTNGIGFVGDILNKSYEITVNNDAVSTSVITDEGYLADPYWDSVTWEFVSATLRNIYINGVLQKSDTTNMTPDLSAGSPQFRISIRGFAPQTPFIGSIAHVICGSGTLSAGDRTLFAIYGANYSTMTGAMHWWPLTSTPNDSIGSLTLTESAPVTYSGDNPTAVAFPTKAALVQYVFKGLGLPAATCTVTAGGSPPVTVTTNLASVEHITGSYVGNDVSVGSPFTFQHWHWTPTAKVSPRHLVLVNGGHEEPSGLSTFGIDAVVQQLVGAGYDTLLFFMPGFDPTDPLFPQDTTAHLNMWARLSPTINPIEKHYGQIAMTLNTIASNYGKISFTGLSGGSVMAPHYSAMDTRINHAMVAVRGSMADKRSTGSSQDFEQWPKAKGFLTEHVWYLAAATNRRLWVVHSPTDVSVAAKAKSASGAYLDATTYRASFFAPISAMYPLSDVQFFEDQGSPNTHFYSQWAIDNVLLPALSQDLVVTAGHGARHARAINRQSRATPARYTVRDYS